MKPAKLSVVYKTVKTWKAYLKETWAIAIQVKTVVVYFFLSYPVPAFCTGKAVVVLAN